MPKINVYVSDDLAKAVREAGIPVSAVCQRALADAVAAADGPEVSGKLSGDMSRFTAKARAVVSSAREVGDAATAVDVVTGLAGEGPNLATTVLGSLGVDAADAADHVRAAAGRVVGKTAPDALDTVMARALDEAMRLGHNYVGCEHLLLAVLAGKRTEPTVAALRSIGVTYEPVRQAVVAALAGVVYARDNVASGYSAPIRSALDEIRQRLSRLESGGRPPP